MRICCARSGPTDTHECHTSVLLTAAALVLYQAEEGGPRVLLVSLKAGGAGVNLVRQTPFDPASLTVHLAV